MSFVTLQKLLRKIYFFELASYSVAALCNQFSPSIPFPLYVGFRAAGQATTTAKISCKKVHYATSAK